jgi:hypothetical protein
MVFPYFRMIAAAQQGISPDVGSATIAQIAQLTSEATVMRSTTQIIELGVQTIMLPTLGPLADTLG